jgi:hypothetical protein
MSDAGVPVFAVSAMRYRSNSAATLAHEEVLPVFSRWVASGDSLYRFTLDGHPTLAVLCGRRARDTSLPSRRCRGAPANPS